jgi:hypothetical protein
VVLVTCASIVFAFSLVPIAAIDVDTVSRVVGMTTICVDVTDIAPLISDEGVAFGLGTIMVSAWRIIVVITFSVVAAVIFGSVPLDHEL